MLLRLSTLLLYLCIGKAGRDIRDDADAMSHVMGYTIGNDITARDLQKRHNQWFKGKSLDGMFDFIVKTIYVLTLT